MYPSDKRMRIYASGASKRRKKRRKLENVACSSLKMKEYFAVESAVKHKSSATVVVDPIVPLLEDDRNSSQLCKIPEPENFMKLDETHDEADVNTSCHYDSITSTAKSIPDVIDDISSTIHTASAAMQSYTASVESNVVCLDIIAKYPTDQACFTRNVSNELRELILNYGPCRPQGPFPINKEFG